MIRKFSIIVFLFSFFFAGVSAKGNKTKEKNDSIDVWLIGVSHSFNDSVVYMTEPLVVNGAWLHGRDKFLGGYSNYASQLRQYIDEKVETHRLNSVYFTSKKVKAEKKYLKLKTKYTQKQNFDVRPIPANEFAFKRVTRADVGIFEEVTTTEEPKAKKKKAEKMEKKNSKKAAKENNAEVAAQKK